MANFYRDNDDLQFYVDHWIDWARLAEVTEHGFHAPDGFKNSDEATQFYKESIEMFGDFVGDEVAPYANAIDREEMHVVNGEVQEPAKLREIFAKLKALDVHGLNVPRELGGLNCPLLVYFVSAEMFGRADVSMMTHHSFHGGMAMAALIFSLYEGTTKFDENGRITSTRFEAEMREMARGDAWGAMDITEPDAGSDMAALRTRGEQDADGNWFVTGQKIFITSGHGKYHFVIARTEEATSDDAFAGLQGLSFFLVKTFDDLPDGTRTRYATVERVEDKLGHHASATCAISFDRTPAQLIGKRGDGFKHMLVLMNNARLGVGFESLGLCEAAWRGAAEYASVRKSMGKTIDQHEMIADYLDEMRTDIQGIRAIAMHGAFHEEMANKVAWRGQLGSKDENERQAKWHRKLARRVTPLLKYLAAEKAVEIARRGVQIHGGVGYTREYGAEKLLRDAMVMPIYEGTSQIQSLMAMKDTLNGIIKNPQDFVRRIAQTRWRSLSARDALERRVARVQALSLGAQQHLLTRTTADKLKTLRHKPLSEWASTLRQEWDPKHDFAFAMLHAERLTKILADEVVCELLWEQARKFPARRDVLERYLERAEPRVRFLHDEITTTGHRLIASLHGSDASAALDPHAGTARASA